MPGFDDRAVGQVLAELASPGAAPAAGVATALTCAQAAALVELTAVLAANRIASENGEAEERLRELGRRAREARKRALTAADEDVDAYSRVIDADDASARALALERASEPPLAVAEVAAEVAASGAEIAAAGDWPFTADAVVAARLAAVAAAGALELVSVNLGRGDDSRISRAREAAERARRAAG
jgi:formiminotetrahydrofolate cyclodeaminase